MTDYLPAKQCVLCPTCGLHSSQTRGSKRGERYCGVCGETFTLKESRKAEREEAHLAAVDFKYDQQEAGR